MLQRNGLSRRQLLQRIGAAGVAATLPVHAQAVEDTAAPTALDEARLQTLEAITARLIPSDANGPGATEARAARYIDRSLAGYLAPLRERYVAGLAAVDAWARSSRGAAFAELAESDQDAVLTDMERDTATGFEQGASAFFALLREHTIQGTFADPHYGGNAGFVGWDMIGFPGVRTGVSASQQALGVIVEPSRRSAYDIGMFSPRGS